MVVGGDDMVAELGRRVEADGRIAAALVELERHPGHQLLVAGPLTGTTAARWAAAAAALTGLWESFAIHQRVVAEAGAVLARRPRPGEPELAELRMLLREPTIEVRRTVVERRLSGDVVDVESITLDQLAARMELAFRGVTELVEECAALHSALLAGLEPLAARAAAARALAHELGRPGELAGITAQIHELDRDGTADPLSLAGGVLARGLVAIDIELAAVAARLAEQATVRAGWDDTVAELTAGVAELGEIRASALQARQRAIELIVCELPAVPPDQQPVLRSRLAAMSAPSGWPERARAAEQLSGALAAATGELRHAHELAAGLLQRRTELRGRLDAYRAKSTRIGVAEHPDLLTLDEQLRHTLWTAPCDLAAATRALAAYQQRLQSLDATRGQGRTA